jgi:hypothetical protein
LSPHAAAIAPAASHPLRHIAARRICFDMIGVGYGRIFPYLPEMRPEMLVAVQSHETQSGENHVSREASPRASGVPR